jgi:tripartite-type tricarboxylate transporter receptor subunit TctC
MTFFIPGLRALCKENDAGKRLERITRLAESQSQQGVMGTHSVGSRLFATFFQKETGTQIAIVPYRGVAPVIQDVVSGQIDLYMGAPDSLSLMRAGNLKAYAVTGETRLTAIG